MLGLVWDEKTSNDLIKKGIVGTYDEETKRFFQGTNVHMEYVYREMDQPLNPLQGVVYKAIYRSVMVTLYKTIYDKSPKH